MEMLHGKIGVRTMNNHFWHNKKVFITGHTGFKGSWLVMTLAKLGAQITGYSLAPNTSPNLYSLCKVEELLEKSYIADIRDQKKIESAIEESCPDIIFHMAAQPLVRESYLAPRETFEVNIMGTINILEAARKVKNLKALINITTDKVYDNKEWHWGYRENEPLGGHDPYSSSKACSELVTQAYRNSFFEVNDGVNNLALASVRAGNVIGGGDWAKDRLIPDCLTSLLSNKEIIVRNPSSVRPWQHVLEPLSGYMMLAEKLYLEGAKYASAWNFGPADTDAKPVDWIVKKLCETWGSDAKYVINDSQQPHEATYLKLDCSKANTELNWNSKWNIQNTLIKIVEWTKAYENNSDMREMTYNQIEEYFSM